MSRGSRLRNAQRLPHVRSAVAYLRNCGADHVEIVQGRSIRLKWAHDSHKLAISLSAAGSGTEQSVAIARQAIRRRYRAHGIEVGAS